MKRIVYVLLVLAGTLCACEDFLDEKSELDITNNNFWQNERDLQGATYGMMYQVREGVRSLTSWDQFLQFDYVSSSLMPFYTNEIEPDDAGTNWNALYAAICAANTIMENIYRADMPKDRRDFYYGQALCARSYLYFFILRRWGDALLILNSLDLGEKPRESWLKIADQIEGDLWEAARLLPGARDLKNMNGEAITTKDMASKGTAYAVLAHLYAWRGAVNHEPDLFAKGIAAADSVINSGDYELAADPGEVCDEVMFGNSREGILEMYYNGTTVFNMISRGAIIGIMAEQWPVMPQTTPATKRTLCRTSNEMVNRIFSDRRDKRRDEYFYKLDSMAGVSTAITFGAAYVNKWRAPYIFPDGSQAGKARMFLNNIVLIRLADIILLRAEMKARVGDDAGAIADVNTIRDRAGAAQYDSSEGNVQEVVALERDRELFLEPLVYYYDVVRNGTFRERFWGDFKTLTDQDVADGALFVPVHSDAFKNNTLMQQTVYWKRKGHDF